MEKETVNKSYVQDSLNHMLNKMVIDLSKQNIKEQKTDLGDFSFKVFSLCKHVVFLTHKLAKFFEFPNNYSFIGE